VVFKKTIMKMENQALVSNVNFLAVKEKIQELELISTIQNLYKEIKRINCNKCGRQNWLGVL
jgi:hypothetical protein